MRALGVLLDPFLRLKRRFPLPFYILGRAAAMVVMLFVFGMAVFALMDIIPGDAVSRARARVAAVEYRYEWTQEQVDMLREREGLDQTFFAQYFRWLARALRGDMGVTLIWGAPVAFLIRQRLLNTLLLSAISLAITSAVAFALGIFFSSKAGSRADLAGSFATLLALSIPPLVVLLGLQFFAFVTGLFPVVGYPRFPFWYDRVAFVFSYIRHVFILVLANLIIGAGVSLRMTRALMLDQVGLPYMISLRSRGISERRVFFVHAFRNALNPFVSWVGVQIAGMLAGSIMLETIFAYPGIGLLMVQAVLEQDVNLIMAILLVASAAVMVAMLLADIALAFLDPRVRYGKG